MVDVISENISEFLGLNEKPTRKKRTRKTASKKVAKTKAKRVGRPPKSSPPAAKPRKLPKTKLLAVRFKGDEAELSFRDFRKLKTPLKYLDKRLTKLTGRELRAVEISKNGKTLSWPAKSILVEVAYAMHCEG